MTASALAAVKYSNKILTASTVLYTVVKHLIKCRLGLYMYCEVLKQKEYVTIIWQMFTSQTNNPQTVCNCFIESGQMIHEQLHNYIS